ncbi:MAG: ElyC/SanA/YdcF family protein, partial [Desulfonatronovibrionaceae bacterium]
PPAAQVPSGLDYIVVLGSGHDSAPGFPANSRASSTTVARVVEGLRIKSLAPGAKVIFTGGRIYDPQSNARVMAGVARGLGLERSRMILEEESMDTADHVRYLQPILEAKEFVLVTSASHMPRAAALFRAGGLDPLPSSTDYRALHMDYSPWDFFPSANALEKTRRFFYECLGLAWARVSGQI